MGWWARIEKALGRPSVELPWDPVVVDDAGIRLRNGDAITWEKVGRVRRRRDGALDVSNLEISAAFEAGDSRIADVLARLTGVPAWDSALAARTGPFTWWSPATLDHLRAVRFVIPQARPDQLAAMRAANPLPMPERLRPKCAVDATNAGIELVTKHDSTLVPWEPIVVLFVVHDPRFQPWSRNLVLKLEADPYVAVLPVLAERFDSIIHELARRLPDLDEEALRAATTTPALGTTFAWTRPGITIAPPTGDDDEHDA